MDAVSEFPFVQDLPKQKQSLVKQAWDTLTRLQAANTTYGGLVPVMVAAKALNVSRTRIDQLVEAGKLERVEVEGHVFIGGRSVAKLAMEERSTGGRPRIYGGPRIIVDIARGVASEIK